MLFALTQSALAFISLSLAIPSNWVVALIGLMIAECTVTFAHDVIWHGPLTHLHQPHHDCPHDLSWTSADSLTLATQMLLATLFFCFFGGSWSLMTGFWWHYYAVVVLHDGWAHGRMQVWDKTPEIVWWHKSHHVDPGSCFSFLRSWVMRYRSQKTNACGFHVCIVGQGITALTAAAYLENLGFDVSVVPDEGTVIEPDVVFDKQSVLTMCRELDLNPELPPLSTGPLLRYEDGSYFTFKSSDFETIERDSYEKCAVFMDRCAEAYQLKSKWWMFLSKWSDMTFWDHYEFLKSAHRTVENECKDTYQTPKLQKSNNHRSAMVGN